MPSLAPTEVVSIVVPTSRPTVLRRFAPRIMLSAAPIEVVPRVVPTSTPVDLSVIFTPNEVLSPAPTELVPRVVPSPAPTGLLLFFHLGKCFHQHQLKKSLEWCLL